MSSSLFSSSQNPTGQTSNSQNLAVNKLKPMAKHIENQVINIYPDFEKQSFI